MNKIAPVSACLLVCLCRLALTYLTCTCSTNQVLVLVAVAWVLVLVLVLEGLCTVLDTSLRNKDKYIASWDWDTRIQLGQWWILFY